jgi:hypothetical protein
LIEDAVIGSLKVAVSEVPKLIPVLLFAGVTDVTVGGVLEPEVRNTTSTQ